MALDLALYRRRLRISTNPTVHLSAIDIYPESPQYTLVFLHGYGGQALQWQYQLHEFSFSNRAIALDLRGHGKSDKPDGGYNMAHIQEDLETALDQLQVEKPFVMVGHSFGGAVVTEYAIAHPSHVKHLVLIATAGEFILNPLYRLLLQLPSLLLRSFGTFTRGWISAPPHVMHALYHQNLSKWNGWSLFRSLEVPTTIIRGHLDMVFARPLFEEVSRAIPNSDEVDVGASGHMVMLERREAVNRVIQRVLERASQSEKTRSNDLDSSARGFLARERPWVSRYDSGVPETIAVPRIRLFDLLRSAANRFPLHSAIIFEGNRITYRRLNHEVNRFANALLSLGVHRGDRVMLLLPNLPQMVIAYYGTLKAGGVVVFTLPSTDPVELIREIRKSGVRVLVTLTEFDSLIEQIKIHLQEQVDSPLEHIIFTHIAEYLPLFKKVALTLSPEKRKRHLLDISLDASMHRFNPLLYSHSSRPPEVEIEPEDLAVIQFTGGTTAIPKGVMLSHRNLVANAIQTRHWVPKAREGRERFLCVVPFSHAYGLTTALNLPVALGATLILKPTFNVADILKTIQRYRPTIFPGVPRMYMAIKDFPGVRRYGINSITACISGSAPLPVEVQEAFEKLTRGRLVEGYGLTEAGCVTHGNPLEGLRKIGSIGIPIPSTDAQVVDLVKGKSEVKTGQIGELAVSGPQIMMGYWDQPDETRRVFNPDGYLLTGDVARMDVDGYFHIIARKADLWYPDKPGKPAFPREVEEVLYEVPQVKEAAVVAIANQPIAFVIAQKEGPSAESLIAYCARRLPPELVPRVVIFLEEFPRSFIGKVLRRELARRYEASERKNVGPTQRTREEN